MRSDPNRPQSSQQAAQESFSRDNPPPDMETASSKLEELEGKVIDIETQLEHVNPGSFSDVEAHQLWRRRATYALAYTKKERAFLREWIQERKKPSQKPNRRPYNTRGIYDDLQLVANKIRQRAVDLAREAGSQYAALYSLAVQPPSMAAAQERMTYLGAMKQQLQGAFGEITAEWTKHPLVRADLPGVKLPLQQLMAKVEVEIAFVKGYIQVHSNQDFGPYWKRICAGALTRAVAQGFILTPDEQAVFDHMRKVLQG